MPQPNSQSLHAQIAELKGQLATMTAERHQLARRLEEAGARASNVAGDTAELKRLLAEAREEIADLKGYIRHGHEMDDAASERVAVQTAPEPLVPRSRLARQNGHSGDDGVLHVVLGREPRHWTEIG